ncbi:MAG TPA: hypothetical protein GX502_07140 [Syntrophaceticus sp.]|nr:hypothetical protein [Syntrophaceticus sp.]
MTADLSTQQYLHGFLFVANILRELKGLQNRFGFAMLYITHELHLARKVAAQL